MSQAVRYKGIIVVFTSLWATVHSAQMPPRIGHSGLVVAVVDGDAGGYSPCAQGVLLLEIFDMDLVDEGVFALLLNDICAVARLGGHSFWMSAGRMPSQPLGDHRWRSNEGEIPTRRTGRLVPFDLKGGSRSTCPKYPFN